MCQFKPILSLLVILISSHVDAVKVKIKNEVTIVAVNKDKHTYLMSDCQVEQEMTSKVRESDLEDYAKIRDFSLAVKQESPAISNTQNTDYIWSETFSKDEKDFFVTRLDKNTVVYSSEYFPKYFARVIISGNVIIFVHTDGNVIMKTKDCLHPDEKKLVKGVKKINTGNGITSYFSSKDDTALKKYLQAHPINYDQFWREQKYEEPLTEEELRKRAERDRAITRSLRGSILQNDRPLFSNEYERQHKY